MSSAIKKTIANNNDSSVQEAPGTFSRLIKKIIRAEETHNIATWGKTEEDRERFNSAKAEYRNATEMLKKAMASAKWGQNGAVFITDKRSSFSNNDRYRELYINGRLRATVTIRWRRASEVWLNKVYNREEAEETYREQKEIRRQSEETYKEERIRLQYAIEAYGHTQLSNFADWIYTYGQEYGTFHRAGCDVRVAADRSMRAIWGDQYWNLGTTAEATLHEDEWDRKCYNTKY